MLLKYLSILIYLISFVSCGQRDPSRSYILKVVNGKETQDFPAVAQLDQGFLGLFGFCTGTFIKHNIMLTAAHCVKGETTLSVNRKKALKYFAHPNYDTYDVRYDIALVLFPENTSSSVVNISTERIKINDRFAIIGFGHNDYIYDDETGRAIVSDQSVNKIKRIGFNIYRGVQGTEVHSENIIYFEGLSTRFGDSISLGENVSVGKGDSGGPMIVDSKGIVAISSGQKLFFEGGVLLNGAYFLDASIESMNDFYKEAEMQGISVFSE